MPSVASGKTEVKERSDFDFLVIEDEIENRLAEEIRLRRVLRGFGVPLDVIVLDADTERGARRARAKVAGTIAHQALHEGRVVTES